MCIHLYCLFWFNWNKLEYVQNTISSEIESTSTVLVLTVQSVDSRKWCGHHCIQYVAHKETVANRMAASSLEFSFSYKGKECLFVEEAKKNLEALLCPVCFGVVLEPVQTSCGPLFCKKCVGEAAVCPAMCLCTSP